MRTRLAATLRRVVDRLAPTACATHHVACTQLDSDGSIEHGLYLDGALLVRSINRHKRSIGQAGI